MKVGLFIDTWYPMVDGVIKVVDNYARRLVQYCEVVVFCPEARGFSKDDDAKLPYKVVRCASLPLIKSDYDFPTPVLDPRFEAQLIRSGIDIVHIHSPFTLGLAGVLYAKLHKLCGEVEVPFKVCAVDYVEYSVGTGFDKVVSCNDFFKGVGR